MYNTEIMPDIIIYKKLPTQNLRLWSNSSLNGILKKHIKFYFDSWYKQSYQNLIIIPKPFF